MQLLKLLRPHQWIKNGFVFFGVLFGHAWSDPVKVALALDAFAAFCLVSSAVYVMNDLVDRERDRAHPTKRHRPLASGRVSLTAAIALMLICGGTGITLAFYGNGALASVILGYVLLNVGYSLGLKHVVILDVFLIAAGFMLRLLAGTLGIGIAPSQWLLLTGLLLTLFLGFAKRRAELAALQDDSIAHRRVLEHYSEPFLDQMITVAAAGVLVAYALYTVSPDTVRLHGTDKLIYTLPFVLYGMFRYLYLLHRRGGGGEPALEIVRDTHLVAAGAGWLGLTLWLLASPAT